MRCPSLDTDALGAGSHLVDAQMMGKVALVVKGTLLNLASDVLRGSARIFDLRNGNTSQKARDYIVITFSAYMRRAAAYKRLRLIKGLSAYLAAKAHLVKAYKQGLFLIRPVIDSACPSAVDVRSMPASRAGWFSDSVNQPGQPSSSALVCSTTNRGYRSQMHRPDFAHRVATLSNMRLHSALNNEMWCTDKIARSYTRISTQQGHSLGFPFYPFFLETRAAIRGLGKLQLLLAPLYTSRLEQSLFP